MVLAVAPMLGMVLGVVWCPSATGSPGSAPSLPALKVSDDRRFLSKMNPRLGRNFEAMDPLEWLARMADHIPDAGKHRTHFYGFYASRVRASRRQTEASDAPAEPAPAKRRCSPSWARLISKVYQADPLVCKGCGGPLKIVAYINDQISIKRILDHLDTRPAKGVVSPSTQPGRCREGRMRFWGS